MPSLIKQLTPASIDQMLADESRTRLSFIHRLESSPIEKAIASGEVLGPLRLVGREGRHQLLEGNAYYSRFRIGDRIQFRVREGAENSTRIWDNEVYDVSYPSEGRLRVTVGTPRNITFDSRTDYFLYPVENDYMLHTLQTTIRDKAEAMKNGRLGLSKAAMPTTGFDGDLNLTQRDAFRYLTSSGQDSAVQGPPGTGKTQLLRSLVAHALASGFRIGVAAFTHAAVDNALSRIASLDPIGEFRRVGRNNMIDDTKYPLAWLEERHLNTFGDTDGSERLFAATTHSWTLSPNSPTVDVMIVDEAGQIPIYFVYPLLQLSRKIVCLGDHKQLPPVLQGNHSKTVPATDLFSCFLSSETPMLNVQFRMNETIQAWPSTRFYNSNLRPDETVTKRDVLNGRAGQPAGLGEWPMQLFVHRFSTGDDANPHEAKLVADLIEKLFAASDRLKPSEIGVISPRRVQNAAIIRALQEKFGVDRASAVQVDTVERYQGQEREVILLSFGLSGDRLRADDVSFVGDSQRLNVAVTRARSRLYCFANNCLTSHASTFGRKGTTDDFASFFSAFPKSA